MTNNKCGWYTPAHLAAVEDLVLKYEQSILDLENGVDNEEVAQRWETFGLPTQCMLCHTAFDNCYNCALQDSCLDDDTYYDMVHNVKDHSNKIKILPVLKARLKWLLEEFDRNGLELK